MRILALSSTCLLVLACGTGTAPNAGSGTDAGSPHDAGTPDSGTPADAGRPDSGTPDAGQHDAGEPIDAGPIIAAVDLFQVSGTVNDFGTQHIQLLTPFVAVSRGVVPHPFDNRNAMGIGCYGDHYDSSHLPTPDINAGTISISGFAGGSFDPSGQSTSPIECSISGSNYACTYSGQSGTADGKAYSSGTNPLGPGPIHFSAAANGYTGAFDLSASPTGTLTVSTDLSSVDYGTSGDITISYSCDGGCGSSLILVTVAATRNSASSPGGASASIGDLSCAAEGGTSITIPQGAIAAMLDGDTALMSAVTSVVLAQASATTQDGATIIEAVGTGQFGITSSL